jgi:hypothetical protein
MLVTIPNEQHSESIGANTPPVTLRQKRAKTKITEATPNPTLTRRRMKSNANGRNNIFSVSCAKPSPFDRLTNAISPCTT